MLFHIAQPRSLIYTYHILKRLAQGTTEGGEMSHFRRGLELLTLHFDFLSYQQQLKTEEDLK